MSPRGTGAAVRRCVIHNPAAGGGDHPGVEAELGSLPNTEVRRTERRGHASRIAGEAVREGFDAVVAAGGDGTVHEVVNGLLAEAGAGPVPRLGIVPLGTGNDLARSLGIPAGVAGAREVLQGGVVRRLDVVGCTPEAPGSVERYYANFALGGFAGDVSRRIDPGLRRRWGSLVYLRAALPGLARLVRYGVEVRVDGERLAHPEVLAVVLANGRYLGHGIPIAPRAEPDDGVLDLLVIPDTSALRLAGVVARVLAGRHLASPRVVWRRAKEVVVRADPPMPFNADGEDLGSTSASFRVLPSALRVTVPGQP